MTARERFVEAIINIDLYHIDPQGRSDLRLVVEAFADAECEAADSDCPGLDSKFYEYERKFYEYEHEDCRAALLKECGLGE